MRSRAATLMTLLTLALLRPAAAQEQPVAPAHLALVDGEVLVQRSGTSTWVPAAANIPLGPGDWVWVVGRGRAETRMSMGASVRLGNTTRLLLQALPEAEARLTRISVERGAATISLAQGGPRQIVEVDLGQASVRAVRPAVFRSQVFPDGAVQVSVHAAEVVIETTAGPIEVGSRQIVRLEPGRAPKISALAVADELDHWKELRDRQPLSLSTVYLPRELASYASDLLAFGRWAWTPEYGYIWVPRVSQEWMPYQQGQWLWWREEYVWVADEPWGWGPSHYGRWLSYPPIGWVWVPPATAQVIWNPGAVTWMTGPGFVAWCPLAPEDLLDEHPDSGAPIVNITNVQVTSVLVTKVFINRKVTVVPHDAFLAGRRGSRSALSVADLFAAGGRVVHELPAPLRAVKMGVSPRRFDFDGRVFGNRASGIRHASPSQPAPQSPTRTTRDSGTEVFLARPTPLLQDRGSLSPLRSGSNPQAGGDPGIVGVDRASLPSATGSRVMRTPPPGISQPAYAITPPPAQGAREAGPALPQRGPSFSGTSSSVRTGSPASAGVGRSLQSGRY